jgi:acyl dehydratase
MKNISIILMLLAVWAFIIIGLFTFLAGCGTVVTYYPDGKVSGWEVSFIKTVNVGSATTTEKGIRIVKGTSTVDDEAVKAITAGVVEGVLKGVKP